MAIGERAEVLVSEEFGVLEPEDRARVDADEVERLEERVHELLRAIDASRIRIERLHASLDEALERNGLGRTLR